MIDAALFPALATWRAVVSTASVPLTRADLACPGNAIARASCCSGGR